jgi:predicted kinase
MKKDLYILRATSNSGKSTIAKELAFRFKLFGKSFYYPICTADDYFEDKHGNYNFDVTKLGKAHKECVSKCKTSMINNSKKIIIANTNTSESELNTYIRLGEQFGYRIFVLVIEKRHNGTNNHNVPESSLIKQEEKLRNSIKLR